MIFDKYVNGAIPVPPPIFFFLCLISESCGRVLLGPPHPTPHCSVASTALVVISSNSTAVPELLSAGCERFDAGDHSTPDIVGRGVVGSAAKVWSLYRKHSAEFAEWRQLAA